MTVNKDAIPDDPWDFHFGTQGSGLSSFFLDDDGDEDNELQVNAADLHPEREPARGEARSPRPPTPTGR